MLDTHKTPVRARVETLTDLLPPPFIYLKSRVLLFHLISWGSPGRSFPVPLRDVRGPFVPGIGWYGGARLTVANWQWELCASLPVWAGRESL